jgi:predicted transcriptional regulator of viral defense system
MGAILTCGKQAVLSHGDAAAHWGFMPAHGALIHVSTPARSGRAPDRGRIRLHRTGTLTAGETTLRDAIPVTTPARTLFDLGRLHRGLPLAGDRPHRRDRRIPVPHHADRVRV